MPDYRICEIGQNGRVLRVLIELTVESDPVAIALCGTATNNVSN